MQMLLDWPVEFGSMRRPALRSHGASHHQSSADSFVLKPLTPAPKPCESQKYMAPVVCSYSYRPAKMMRRMRGFDGGLQA